MYVYLIVGWLLPTAISTAVLLVFAKVVSTTVSPVYLPLFVSLVRADTTTMLISLAGQLALSMGM